MRKLLFGLIALTILSQIPQVSNQFKEEQQGLDAAYGKIARVYDTVSYAYDKTQSDVRVIKTRLDKTKQDIDKSAAYTEKANNEISGFFRTLTSLLNSNRDATETPTRDDKRSSGK